MIRYEEALDIIISVSKTFGIEKAQLLQSQNRVLAQNVISDTDMPPFNKAAVDGYACRIKEIDNELKIIETINAGKKPELIVGENQCAKIMTGAVVPKGADCVFMYEDSEVLTGNYVKCTNTKTKLNICYTGEDVKTGDVVLQMPHLIKAKELPIIAGTGYFEIDVYKQPRVSIIASGTELKEPWEKPEYFQIRNTNSYQLIGQMNELGFEADYLGIVRDDKSELKAIVQKAIEQSDGVIITGGASESDYDLVPIILKDLGYVIHFNKTAIQPGKPMIFAVKANKFCFGLSGNPVSSFVQFELYVKSFLLASMGLACRPQSLKIPLLGDFSRRKDKRLLLVPGYINKNHEIETIEFHGSAHINALGKANCLFEIPIGIKELKKGDLVNARLI